MATRPKANRATFPATPAPSPEVPENPAPYRTLKALADRLNDGSDYPSFSVHGLRHYVYAAEAGKAPGLLPYIRRIGRKILISEPGFLYWLQTLPNRRDAA
jgi:hypothetical protein